MRRYQRARQLPKRRAIGLSRYVKGAGCTFAEAYAMLVGQEMLILIDVETRMESTGRLTVGASGRVPISDHCAANLRMH